MKSSVVPCRIENRTFFESSGAWLSFEINIRQDPNSFELFFEAFKTCVFCCLSRIRVLVSKCWLSGQSYNFSLNAFFVGNFVFFVRRKSWSFIKCLFYHKIIVFTGINFLP